jgi:hypothetical protein
MNRRPGEDKDDKLGCWACRAKAVQLLQCLSHKFVID